MIVLFLRQESHYVTLAVLELTQYIDQAGLKTHRSACLSLPLPLGLKAYVTTMLGTTEGFLGKHQFIECERRNADALMRRIFFHAGPCIPYLKILVFISRTELLEDLNTGIWQEHRGNLDSPLQRKLWISSLIC